MSQKKSYQRRTKKQEKNAKKNVVPSSSEKKEKNDFVSFTLTSKKKRGAAPGHPFRPCKKNPPGPPRLRSSPKQKKREGRLPAPPVAFP
jgi:hypothetical protein